MIISKAFLINEVPQWLYIRIVDQAKPTLLFVHGGPGWVDAPWAGIVCKLLWKDFNTIHWDQRGANRSLNDKSKETPLTIAQMIEDGMEVCRVLKNEFQIDRPVLVGHSWGAFLGALLAESAPDLFHSFVGIGQLVSNEISEPISLAYCKGKAKELGRTDLLSELKSFQPNFYRHIPSLFRQREILAELGGEFLVPLKDEALNQWILTSPKEYRAELKTIYEGCVHSSQQLWPELIEKSLFDEVRELALPVVLLQGEHDYCTPSAPVVKWFDQLSCPKGKNLFWFQNSAHWPQIEKNKKFAEIVRKVIF